MVAVFVSDEVWDAIGERLRALDPGVERVPFVPGERVPPEAVERIEVAFLSMDLWPRSSAAYMRVCLDAPNLRWLHSGSAGVDNPVFRHLIDQGVRLTNSSGAAATAIAHHVTMCLLALRRDLPGFVRDQAEHAWRQRSLGDVEATRLGMVGMGPIGLETARLAAALGIEVIGVRRTVRGDEPCETWTLDRLHELLPTIDTLVLALPLTDTTRQLIGAAELAMLPAGAHVVNVGRGELVDEPALVDALQRGHVGAAALDVTAVEPLPNDSPLWDMPNVIITPHSSAGTASSRRRAQGYFADEFAHYVAGEPFERGVR